MRARRTIRSGECAVTASADADVRPITSISETAGEHGRGQVVAELDVRPDLWFFACHFKGDPVMPGCLGLDALWQMLGFFLGWIGAPEGDALLARAR